MSHAFKITIEDFKLLAVSTVISLFAFFGFYYVYADQTPTLNVSVQSAGLTVVVTTNDFANLTPGTPQFATSTLSVDTNNASGWYVTLSLL